jgi:hypothetical protein
LIGTPFATKFIVENGTPPDIQSLLLRFDAMEKQVADLKAENTRLKAELARKDKIIAGLQQQLFGSSSEKLDPAQLQFELDQLLLGKPVSPPDPSGETSAPEEGKPNVARTRRTKADRFPKNLKIFVEKIIIDDQVLANPDDWDEIGEEHHDELDVIKAEIFWRRTIRRKFVHKTDKTRPPVIAPAPLPSIPGTLLAPALAAQIITDKYQDHPLPHGADGLPPERPRQPAGRCQPGFGNPDRQAGSEPDDDASAARRVGNPCGFAARRPRS